MRVAGIVLCGGRSSRMGRPKAWLPFGGETLLHRTVRTLREAVDPVVVVAAPGQDVPPLPAGVRIVCDEVEDRGPLGGLAAGLAALDGQADAAYLSACDVPFLTPAFVSRVVELLGDAEIAVPHVGDHFQPLAAAYRLSVLPHVRDLLAANRLRVVNLFDAVAVRLIESDDLTDLTPLRNVNTPDEYREALRDAGERPG